MTWLTNLVSYWAQLAGRWASIAGDIRAEWWAPSWLKSAFLSISSLVDGIYGAFFDFQYWLQALVNRVDPLVRWDQVGAWLSESLSQVATLWTWWLDRRQFITWEVDTWWESVRWIVLGWIDAAAGGIADLRRSWESFSQYSLPELLANVNKLSADWSNFTRVTLPGLASFQDLEGWYSGKAVDVRDLIESTIRSFFPFYDEIVGLWGEIREMFTDPEAYLLRKIETMLVRFW